MRVRKFNSNKKWRGSSTQRKRERVSLLGSCGVSESLKKWVFRVFLILNAIIELPPLNGGTNFQCSVQCCRGLDPDEFLVGVLVNTKSLELTLSA